MPACEMDAGVSEDLCTGRRKASDADYSRAWLSGFAVQLGDATWRTGFAAVGDSLVMVLLRHGCIPHCLSLGSHRCIHVRTSSAAGGVAACEGK